MQPQTFRVPYSGTYQEQSSVTDLVPSRPPAPQGQQEHPHTASGSSTGSLPGSLPAAAAPLPQKAGKAAESSAGRSRQGGSVLS